MTDIQQELARHALGLPNKQRLSYRNSFCASKGHSDHSEWEAMVADGLAIKRISALWGGDDMFHLTLKGALLALALRSYAMMLSLRDELSKGQTK